MNLTFTEKHTAHVGLIIDVDKQLFAAQSAFQRIDVFESPEFGRILTLDGFLMLTEKDEFIYHEMIAHVPMAVHPAAKNILVIGGGDGGAARELCRYDAVAHIDLVEIDRDVVDVCRSISPPLPQPFRPARAYPLRGRPALHPALQRHVRYHHRGFHRPVRAGGRPVPQTDFTGAVTKR